MPGSIEGRFLRGTTMGHVVRMTLAGSVGVMFMFLVDAANLFWVSLLGVERLVAALGFAWTIQFFAISVGIGLGVAATASVSTLIGQHNRAEARRQASVCALAAFLVQLGVSGLILWFRADLLVLVGAEGQTAAKASRYLLISVPSLPVMSLGMVGSAVLRAEGDALRVMMVTLTSGLVSMVIDPTLIYGLGMGLDGAAIALASARILSAGLSVYFVIGHHDLVGRINARDIRRLLAPFLLIAGPVVLTQLSTPFGNYVVTSVIASFGDGAVAGWAVVSRLTLLAFGGLFALSSAIGGIFGQNFGAARFDRVRQTYLDSLRFCLIYTLIAWALLAFLTTGLIRAFGLGPEAARVVSAFTHFGALGWVFAGGLFVANAAFNNLGRPIFSTLFNWLRDGVLLLPVVLLASADFAAPGAVYGQALVSLLVGAGAVAVGWSFVTRLAEPQARARAVDAP